MRAVVLFVTACATAKPVPVAPCPPAYASYEQRWSEARSAELAEVGFEATAAREVVASEITRLPSTTELAKLRAQYTAMVVFLPDTPWPRALDAAEAAIAVCGDGAPRP